MIKFIGMISLAAVVIVAACSASPTAASASGSIAGTEGPAPAPTAVFSSGGVVASGSVIPAIASNMSLAISAPVKQVLVHEGDRVRAGQSLLTLSVPNLELAVVAAQAEAKSKQLDLAYWIPRLDRPPERRQQAQAEADQAQANVTIAQAELGQATLLAPFDATVVEVDISEGETAQAGQTVIKLGDLSKLQIETTDLSERDVPKIQAGQKVTVHVAALNADYPGRVVRIAPRAVTLGGDAVFPVRIELDQQPAGLLWGMTVVVEFQSE